MGRLWYTTNTWMREENDGTFTVGILPTTAERMGDIVFVELPEIGRLVGPHDESLILESNKSVSDLKLPISGVVVATNESLTDAPGILNTDPMLSGWLVRLRPTVPPALTDFLDQQAYDMSIRRAPPDQSDA
jgi:glycine cleavage system H protein